MATFTGRSANETITPTFVSGTVTRVPAGSFPSNAVDTIFAGDGADIVDAGGGNDSIVGGLGNDTLRGGDGNDRIEGDRDFDSPYLYQGGSDTSYGGAGNDRILGGKGDDILHGDDGDDVIGNLADEDIDWGRDTLYGGAGNDTLYGSTKTAWGGAGNDTYYVDGTSEQIIEASGEGTDHVVLTNFFGGNSYTLQAKVENLTLQAWFGFGDVGPYVFPMDGTGNALNNVITGNDEVNVLTGLGGNDTLKGLAGNDNLYGGDGNDILDGGTGADRMLGGTGTGNDTFYVDNAGDQVVEYSNQGTDTVFSSISHTLASNVENLTLTGSALNGTGNGLNNVITGNGAKNVLSGLAGADTLVGGANADVLIGGTGPDRFDFNFVSDSTATVTARDAIRAGGGAPAFEGAGVAGGDVIDLSGIDANTGMTGNQAFVFGGTDRGHLSLVNSGTTTIVNANVDADAAFEFVLAIDDGGVLASAYKAGDFIL